MSIRHAFRVSPRSVFTAAALVVASAAPAAAQQNPTVLDTQGYLTPPDEIREALLAPWYRNVELDELAPGGRYFVVEEHTRRMPPLAAFAKKHHILGGVQIDPLANRARDFNTDAAEGLHLIAWESGDEIEIDTPEGALVSNATFSPDGSRLAFFAHFDDATHIYVADPASGDARQITDTPVLATLVDQFAWSGDGRYVFTVLIPEGRGAEPVEPAVATTPGIWHTLPENNELRTYPSLLETPHEFALLEHYTIGQLARIEVEGGDVTTIGEPAMIRFIDPNATGEYLRVGTIRKPYSDIVAVGDFATAEEVWSAEGEVLVELASQPIDDGDDDDDGDDEEEGRRMIQWRPDGQGLSFVRREPGPARDSADTADDDQEEEGDEDDDERPDRVMQWTAPFTPGSARVVHEAATAIEEVAYTADGGRAFVTTSDDDDEHLYVVSLGGSTTADTLYTYDTEDFYADPGELMMRPGPLGGSVVRLSGDGRSVFLSGTLYHENPRENAPRPFVDRMEIASGETTRVFESAADRYEQVVAVLDDAFQRVVIERESPTEVPNYHVQDLGSGDVRALTENENYAPELTSEARHHLVEVERADGVTFQVRVTLPADYREGTRLPAIFWHYPGEFDSEEAYDEEMREYNKNEFPGVAPRSMEHLLLRGWAVVEPDIPIIGPSEDLWNDYYVSHLRSSLAAAIAELVDRGWIDQNRLAIGGHSYGGFGTINAMIHTPFFKAGIAGASNTNRALTPAGFQNESRTLWEGRETYIRMSPIFWLNELTGALLMYHDMEDQNVGTFPVNSWRAFHGLNALGKTAALYMYPYEAHGPRAEETLMDLWTRWTAWLDLHVLQGGVREVTDDGSGEGGD